METTGKLTGASRTFDGCGIILTFEVDASASYLMIKGSSEYNTAEMAHFIDRIVEEAQELGIETATPDELERMKQEWGAA